MVPSILLLIGLALAWVGERIVDSTEVRYGLTGIGAMLIVVAVVIRFLRTRDNDGAQRIQRTFVLLHGAALLAFVLYFLQSDLFTKLTGAGLSTSVPKLAGALAALWPALLILSLLPTLLLELSFASMRKSPKLETGRINEALLSGIGLACAFIFAVTAQYVATERDVKGDFSHFRVARPGEATRKLVASLDEPLEVYLFFPPSSDAAAAVEQYFDDLKTESSLLQVSRLDHDLEPKRAKDLGVSGNGTVLLKKGDRKEPLFIGTEVEKAKTQLRGLDSEIQKRILQVARSKRTAYLTAGHGERTVEARGGMDQRATIELLQQVLKGQNFDVRTLTTAEGLGQEVPKDASVVFVVGPSTPFTPGEAAALETYEKSGGRLLIALDPENGLSFDDLLKPLGLSFKPQTLAQERNTATVRPPPGLADRINIGTRTYSSHPSVSNLGRSQNPILLLGAGALEELPQHPADLSIDFAVKSFAETWNDANNNFQFDGESGEAKKAWGLIAAVERRPKSGKPEEGMRALVLGDSDAIGDLVLPQLDGNKLLILDGFKWLLGDEQYAGTTNTEVDVPLTRSRQQDSLWFYGTTFLAPMAVLGLGLVARRRSKSQQKKEKPS